MVRPFNAFQGPLASHGLGSKFVNKVALINKYCACDTIGPGCLVTVWIKQFVHWLKKESLVMGVLVMESLVMDFGVYMLRQECQCPRFELHLCCGL